VALLDSDLYFPDGQIRDEVYEYGLFLQSRMRQADVSCSDCHDPHSLKLRVTSLRSNRTTRMFARCYQRNVAPIIGPFVVMSSSPLSLNW
jgi:hypothetical protein